MWEVVNYITREFFLTMQNCVSYASINTMNVNVHKSS